MVNKRVIRFLIPVGAAVAFIGVIFLFPHFSRLAELKFYDLKMGRTAGLNPRGMRIAKGIKLINVTDSTIKEMGWPSKSHHASLIDILTQHKAAMIAYDWVFHDRDEALVRAVGEAQNFYWPVLFDLTAASGYGLDRYPERLRKLLKASSLGPARSDSSLWQTTFAAASHYGMVEAAAGIGHISARNEEGNPENDGVYRKMALVVNCAGEMLPSLALRLACEHLRVPLANVRVGKDEIVLLQAMDPETGNIADLRIPVNRRGEMWVYFPGEWEDNYFEPFWFDNVLKQHDNRARWPEYDSKFNNSICFVGNASGKNKDVHVIPMEDNFPGMGIHAAALFTILSGNFIYFSGAAVNVLIMLALALSVGLIADRNAPLRGLLFHGALLAGYVVFSFWVFSIHRLSLPVLFPVLSVLGGAVALFGYRFAGEQEEKERLVKKYSQVKTALQKRERAIGELTLRQEQNSRLSEEQVRELDNLKNERMRLILRKEELEKSLARLKDLACQPLPEEVSMGEEWERLRRECGAVGIITQSPRMLELFRRLKKAARSDSSVLVLGESGTGKELAARAIHKLSERSAKEIVIVPTIQENLAESELFGYKRGAFTGAAEDKEGFFAQAAGSTIFLDEVGEIPLNIQVKLLRVLNRGEYIRVGDTVVRKSDARVVAATNRDLAREIEKGAFREDLFFRLNVIPIELPPLRERRKDIELLANHFISLCNHKQKKRIKGLSQKALEVMVQYDWPGNVRELENRIERAVTLAEGELIGEADLEISRSCEAKPAVPVFFSAADPSGDEAFLRLLNRNGFEINKTADDMDKKRGAVAARLKGLCIKAMAENEWEVSKAARSIARSAENLPLAESKVREYCQNTLEELKNYSSRDDLAQQVSKKFKNIPRKFHPYIVQMHALIGNEDFPGQVGK